MSVKAGMESFETPQKLIWQLIGKSIRLFKEYAVKSKKSTVGERNGYYNKGKKNR